MKELIKKFILTLHEKYGIIPSILTYIKIFSAPWLALLISKILLDKSSALTIFTLIIYILIISTSFLNKILEQKISKIEKKKYQNQDILDSLSDKILIIFILIPFGLNLFTFLIISAESILALQILYSINYKKQKDIYTKIKIILQALLIPILILQVITGFVPEMAIYTYIIITIIFTYASLYSHFSDYFYFKNE